MIILGLGNGGYFFYKWKHGRFLFVYLVLSQPVYREGGNEKQVFVENKVFMVALCMGERYNKFIKLYKEDSNERIILFYFQQTV